MADHLGSSSDARHCPPRVQLGFALLIALFGVDFYLDLRARDGYERKVGARPGDRGAGSSRAG